MWRSLLTLATLPAIFAAPLNLPQTITCGGDVYALVNETATDRAAYLFVAVPSEGLHDCVNKCFGNQFCYSLKYDGAQSDSCSLYYYAAYNCSNHHLVPAKTIEYSGKPVTIDCLRCPSSGEFVTAPPFTSFTEQTITAAPGAAQGPQSPKPLVDEITHNIDSKLGENEKNKGSSTSETDFNTDTEATTVSSSDKLPKAQEEAEKTWKGEVEEQVCNGEIRFHASQNVDFETVQLLLNSSTLESATDCAQLCFKERCGFAFYDSSTKECQYTVNTDSLVDNDCRHDENYLSASFEKEGKVQMTCLQCIATTTPAPEVTTTTEAATTSAISKDKTPVDFSVDEPQSTVHRQEQENAPSKGSYGYPACVIKFQMDETTDPTTHVHHDVRRVKSINECARMCFAGYCTTAVYSPSTNECRLGKGVREQCNELDHVSAVRPTKDVIIQCFRCSPQKNISQSRKKIPSTTTAATTEATTTTAAATTTEEPTTLSPRPEISHQEDGGDQSVIHDHTIVTETTTLPAQKETHSVDTVERKHCIIKFQARPLAERPAEFKAPFELEVPVDSVELCATRCYQDGCSGAKYDPHAGSCTLSYDDKQFCERAPVIIHYDAKELTWIHCVNCYTVKGATQNVPSTPSSVGVVTTEAAAETTTTAGVAGTTTETTTTTKEATITEMLPEDEGSLLLHGCVVNFQIVDFSDRPAHFKAALEGSTKVPTAEICAHRCYQDGCSGASFDPKTNECLLSYDDKPFCTATKLVAVVRPETRVWLYCLSCVPHTPGKGGVQIAMKPTEKEGLPPTANNEDEKGTTVEVDHEEKATTESETTQATTTETQTTAESQPTTEANEINEGSGEKEETPTTTIRIEGSGQEEESTTTPTAEFTTVAETTVDKKVESSTVSEAESTTSEVETTTSAQKNELEGSGEEDKSTTPSGNELPEKAIAANQDEASASSVKPEEVATTASESSEATTVASESTTSEAEKKEESSTAAAAESTTSAEKKEESSTAAAAESTTSAEEKEETSTAAAAESTTSEAETTTSAQKNELEGSGEEDKSTTPSGNELPAKAIAANHDEAAATTVKPDHDDVKSSSSVQFGEEVEIPTTLPAFVTEGNTEEATNGMTFSTTEANVEASTVPKEESKSLSELNEDESEKKKSTSAQNNENDINTTTEEPSTSEETKMGSEVADEFINSTLFDQHNAKLPSSVGFVPGSDPTDSQLDKDLEEPEEETTDSKPTSDYEDEVKKSNNTETGAEPNEKESPSTVSTTTEPPVQAVQDLIDALASGGLSNILGPSKRPSASAKDLISKKLGLLNKFIGTPFKQSNDCTDGEVRFVAREMKDLSRFFEADAIAYSLDHCARICYETGCQHAAYTRFPRPVCLMNYSNSTECSADSVRQSSWIFTSIQQVVELQCLTCEKNEVMKQKSGVDITNVGFNIDEPSESVFQGTPSKCSGRLEFHVVPVGSLPRLNVTNDVPARTPADCAKKCFETKGCTTAGFIPSPNSAISSGVCLLTSDDKVCGNDADFIPQHASLSPFVISCMRCSSCTYQLRPVNPTRQLPKWEHHESAESVGKCAEACHERRCTLAQYDANLHTCSMTSAPRERQCSGETSVVTEGTLPVTLECVSCSD